MRAANRLHQSLQPEDPKDMNFELIEECTPQGFYQADVIVKNRQHLIFARPEQLQTLEKAEHNEQQIKTRCITFIVDI